MRDTRRCFCNFSFYDQEAIQKTLEDMAARGWMIQKTGSLLWTYRRTEPKRLRFSVTYFPGASDFDPGPTEGELTRMDFCGRDGWILAAAWGVMQIFYNENVEAVPIETEPLMQVENIRRSMRKNVLFPQAILCGALLFNLLIRFSQWRRDPVGELSDPVSLYSVLMFGVLLLACLYEIGFCLCWSRKARAAAQNDGVFLPVQSRPIVSWMLAALSALLCVPVCSALKGPLGFALLWLCAVPLIMVIGNLIKKHLKRRGVSRGVNRAVSVGSVFLLTLLAVGAMTAAVIRGGVRFHGERTVAGTYELYGRTMEIYDDPLPLEIEELADVRARWSKEADHRETALLSSTEYRQYAVPVDGNDGVDERELSYTVTEVKWGALYDPIKRAVLGSRRDEVHGDFVFTDHYEPVDASVWNADEAYQLHWSDGVLNTYLICWGNRIAEVKFYWEPTREQIAAAAARLKGL